MNFRIWNKIENKWGANLHEDWEIRTNNRGIFTIIEEDAGSILQKSVGLNDYNNKEIFEGDIVDYFNSEGRGLVKWDDDNGLFYIEDINSSWAGLFSEKRKWYRIEIVGNVFENPDLLNKNL